MTTARVDCARPLAYELIHAVRSCDKRGVARVLKVADLPALAVVLAAMVDDERPMLDLLGWADTPNTELCGVPNHHASFERHRQNKEECWDCRQGEREYQRNRPRRSARAPGRSA